MFTEKVFPAGKKKDGLFLPMRDILLGLARLPEDR